MILTEPGFELFKAIWSSSQWRIQDTFTKKIKGKKTDDILGKRINKEI